jgi:arylsulfatase A-like enzyme
MKRKTGWYFLVLYLAILGSFCGLEIYTFVEDLPFFQSTTFIVFLNVLFVLLLPPYLYAIFTSIRPLRTSRVARIGILIFTSVYLHLVILLLLYKANRHIDFDFNFLRYNTSVALPVLWRLFAPWLVALALSMIAFVFIQKWAFAPIVQILERSPRKAWTFFTALTISSAMCQAATINTIRGSSAGFLYANFLGDLHLKNDYRELYKKHITELQSDAPKAVGSIDLSLMGDHIFLVEQESLSGLLAGSKVTPQLMRISQDGILFNKFYGNSIQSERGYECMLCGVPPSVDGYLVNDYPVSAIKKLPCLPQIFKSLGYHPIAFYSGYDNPRVIRLLESMGFEKILADDIMHPGDIKYDWGHREDIFFTRVYEYLQKHYTKEKLFIYIIASATNHTPFKVLDDKFLDKVPFPQPRKFEERIANTTFVQDAYLGYFYDIFKKDYADRSSLLVVSDHSWPIPIHDQNIYNERGAYEENFLITMLFVPPMSRRSDFAIGSKVTQRFSQMDILPTFLNLIGLKQEYLLGESFAPWLLSSQNFKRLAPQKIKLSVQPYGGGYISAVVYPKKYLFDVFGQKVEIFDLALDPKEQIPTVRNADEYLYLLDEFFQSEIPE